MLVALLKNINFGLTYQQPKKATPTIQRNRSTQTSWESRKSKNRKYLL